MLSNSSREIISDVLSRYEGSDLLSSMRPSASTLLTVEGAVMAGSPQVDLSLLGTKEALIELTGLMENKPMSPVSVVFLSMLSKGAGDVRINEVLISRS